ERPLKSAAVIGGAGSDSASTIGGNAFAAGTGGFGGGGRAAISGFARCVSTSPPRARPIAPTAKRTGLNSAKARLLAVLGRSDGEGKSVMTIDLLRARWLRTSARVGPPSGVFVPSGGLLVVAIY